MSQALTCTPRISPALLASTIEDDSSEKRREFAEEALPCLAAVRRFALRLSGGDEAEAEDLVQDTFLRAYRRWETYTPGTRCLSWLFTICRN
ncbi:MAG TPA: sigma factor, partial [Longimicrobiaceae bacterium]|nr:sigma factor [Longimicrobiaceae bacterium]